MEALRDRPVNVRNGQALDEPRLRLYLQSEFGTIGDTLDIRQFPAGYSNLTYLVTAREQQWVLRRAPMGTRAASANDMGREYVVLQGLAGHYTYAPHALRFCADESVVGAPFYLMAYVPGLIVRGEYPDALNADPDLVAVHSRRFVEALAELHAVDYASAGLGSLGKPEGYIGRQVTGWTKRHLDALTPGAPDFREITRWLANHLPKDTGRHSLIHNDYKMDNLIWSSERPGELIGVLDWEMTTLGDPLMDLGATLGYWIEAGDPEDLQAIRNMPSHVPGALTRQQLLENYSAAAGWDVPITQFNFYYVYGLFRRAAICQQIYYRFHHGQASDERFAKLPNSITALEHQARRVIEGSL
jgi:aminoglycoside phosphotransferase (APT) family kinase protein